MRLSEWTPFALLGTARQGLPPAAGDGALASMLRRLDASRPEHALLGAAALVAMHERAGALPERDAGPAIPACPPDALPELTGAAAAMLRRALSAEELFLLPEALALTRKSGRVAPAECVAALLALGTRAESLREAVAGATGERGRWLAALRDDWSWFAGASEDESTWTEGSTAARAAFLKRLRERDPSRARALLAESWSTESSADRPALLRTLETGIGDDDEAFLEAALDDKRKDVRMVAASLLRRLPASALSQRMFARARGLLAFTPGERGALMKLRRARKPVLTVTLPAACDETMVRDGIEPKPPSGIGEKAWWLVQVVRAVPLGEWTRAWDAPPADIVLACMGEEWEQHLLGAFARAAAFQSHAEWAEALAEHAEHPEIRPALLEMISLLPQEPRERIALRLLASARELHEAGNCVLASGGEAMSAGFSREILRWLRTRAAAVPNTLYWSRSGFQALGARLAPEALPTVADPWPTDTAHWASWSADIDILMTTARARLSLHDAFQRLPGDRTP